MSRRFRYRFAAYRAATRITDRTLLRLGFHGRCRGCGLRNSSDSRPIDGCWMCPPRPCDHCGELDSISGASCSCWIKTEDLPVADLKALMAGLGADVEVRHD